MIQMLKFSYRDQQFPLWILQEIAHVQVPSCYPAHTAEDYRGHFWSATQERLKFGL